MATVIQTPTRRELATFLNSQQLITAFESLFNVASTDVPAAAALAAAALAAALAAQTTANAAAPSSDFTGMFGAFACLTVPAHWVLADNLTIGSAASGATNRANADTANLFAYWWNNYSNGTLTIQDSAGTPTARGADAATDFAANKRMPMIDPRGQFIRMWDGGRGIDPGRQVGSAQVATSVATNVGNAIGGGSRVAFAGIRFFSDAEAVLNHDSESNSGTNSDNGITRGAPATGASTAYFRTVRPTNLALLPCWHL